MNNAIIALIIIAVVVIIAVVWNWNYQEYTTVRDQRTLQLALEDCKRLFDDGWERDDCYEQSINAFGTEEQKQQWKRGMYFP